MRSLDELSEAWLELRNQFEKKDFKPAGYFQAFASQGWEHKANRVLYVGKATEGSFGADQLDFSQANVERTREVARSVFEQQIGRSGPTFWGFANAAARSANAAVPPLSNLIWSNIAKIGALSGPPTGRLLDDQLTLAEETLRAEIHRYQPSLVIFVTKQFGETVLRTVASGVLDAAWGKFRESKEDAEALDIWWRESRSGAPAYIWMQHPQGKPLSYREPTLQLVSKLVSHD